jgi:hypothetical protein
MWLEPNSRCSGAQPQGRATERFDYRDREDISTGDFISSETGF